MQAWWERWPGVLAEELRELHEVGHDVVQDEEEFAAGRVVIRGWLNDLAGERVDFAVVYPDTFPYLRAQVFLPNRLLSRHQNPVDRNLCIIGRGSENWQPSMTASMLVQDIPRVLALVHGDPEALRSAEEPQGEPVSTYFQYHPGGVIVPGAAIDELPGAAGAAVLAFEGKHDWLAHPDVQCGLALLAEVHDSRGDAVALADDEIARRFPGQRIEIPWLRLPEPPAVATPAEVASFYASQTKSFRAKCEHHIGGKRVSICAVTFREEVQHQVFGTGWVFPLQVAPRKRRLSARAHPYLLRGMRYGREDLQARIAELSALRTLRVALMGVGSIGSAVALELARSQVATLSLADRDFVDPATTVRWAAGLRCAGLGKVFALKSLIAGDYPFTKVEAFAVSVGAVSLERSVRAELAVLDQWSRNADVIIDATAEENVTALCAELAAEKSIPFFHVYAVDGPYGGLVARVVPGDTGCYWCLQHALHDGSIVPPTSAANRAAVTVQPRGCDDPTFVSPRTELVPLANEVVRLLYSTFCSGAEGGYPGADHDVLVLRLRNPDGTLRSPPKWEATKLIARPDCAKCAATE